MMSRSSQPAIDPQLALTIEQAAEALHISRALAYKAAREGRLPVIHIGRRWLVPRHALETLMGGTNCATGFCSCPCHNGDKAVDRPADVPTPATFDVAELAETIVMRLVGDNRLHRRVAEQIVALLPQPAPEPERTTLRVDGQDVLATTSELATWLQCSKQAVRVWIKSGKIRPSDVRGLGRATRYRIPRSQLARFERRLPGFLITPSPAPEWQSTDIGGCRCRNHS